MERRPNQCQFCVKPCGTDWCITKEEEPMSETKNTEPTDERLKELAKSLIEITNELGWVVAINEEDTGCNGIIAGTKEYVDALLEVLKIKEVSDEQK